MSEPALSLSQLSKLTGISRHMLRAWCNDGSLPHYKFNKRMKSCHSWVVARMAKHLKEPPVPKQPKRRSAAPVAAETAPAPQSAYEVLGRTPRPHRMDSVRP